jgi:hypothetical protein
MASPYRVQIFQSPDDIAPTPTAGMLHLSGLTIVAYFGLRLRREALPAAFDKGLLQEVDGPETYADKLTADAGITCTTLLPGGSLPPVVATAVGASTGPVRQALLWIDPEYALVVVPLVFSVPRADPQWDALPLAQPVGVVEVLKGLRVLAREDVTTSMVEQAVGALEASGILTRDDVLRGMRISDAFGVQLWDLEGSVLSDGGGPRPLVPYAGLDESRRYAWELSAFMSYPIDHIMKDQLWRQRRADQVFGEVGEGFSALDDHMVFVNHCCCLEISHLPVQLKERSRFRMQNYGYDSASMFVWTIGNLRSMVLADLRERYQGTVAELVDKQGLPANNLVMLASEERRHQALVDRLMSFANYLREARLRLIDEVVLRKRFGHDPVAPLRRDMEKAEELAADLVKARDQELQQNTNTLLAFVGAGFAVIGVPGLVEQVGDWWTRGQWLRLGVCGVVVVVILALLYAVWSRRRT